MTVLDVVLISNIVKTENLNFNINDDTSFNSPVILRDNEVENYILKADSIINAFLRAQYGAPSGLRISSWANSPCKDINNTSSESLLGVEILQTSGYTSYITVEFTSGTTFYVTSSLEGNLGSGNTGEDFTTSNGVFTIGTNSWKLAESTLSDKYYFSIIDCYQLINNISALLAASMILSEKYSEAVPNANDYAENLWKKAMNLLENLANPNHQMSLVEEATDISDVVSIDYRSSTLGEDASSYLTDNDLDI